jgi:hypothetical protein
MQVGDTIDAKGPMGKFQYEGRGAYQLNRQPGKVRAVAHHTCMRMCTPQCDALHVNK